jgi:N-sulfoglucosamine sulfohydrolase
MPFTRRGFLATAGIGLMASVFIGKAHAVRRPNILWISTEDISPDLGCYGDEYAHTPNLDKLAGEGALYTNAFSISGVCAPSRSCLITGMYPTSIGTHHMRSQGVPPAYIKCFTEYLRAAGYYCTNSVKTDYNFSCPVTAWDECSKNAHWRNRASGQPFFSVINITTTHERQIRLSDDAFKKRTRNLTPDERHDPRKATLPPYYPDTPIVRKDWDNYYDLITVMDKQVSRILSQLEEDGLDKDTVVFFFGDHGRGLPRAKRWIYDSGMRVPLIIRWPGNIKPETKLDRLVSFVDFAPTLLSLAGVEIPGYMQGEAFLGGREAAPRDYVYAARDRMDETYDIIRAVRDKQYKYIRNYQAQKPYVQYIDYMEKMPTMQEMRRLNKAKDLVGVQKNFFLPEKPEEELYDTVADPHEVNNLAQQSAYGNTLRRFRKAHKQWMKATGDLGLVKEDVLMERVRPGGKWSKTAEPTIKTGRGTYSGAVNVSLACPSKGASIAYTTKIGKKAHWELYSKPFKLRKSAVLRVKACRLGYKDSAVVEKQFVIE